MSASNSKQKSRQRHDASTNERARGRGDRSPRRGKERDDRREARTSRTPQRSGPALEYVLISEMCSISAEITAHPGPLRWRMIPDVALLGPGLYLRYKGSLQLVTEDLSFSDAVLYTVWKDENLAYRFQDGWASPGLRAAFLVRTPFSDAEGPPWIPIDAVVPDTIDAWDTGLLSSQLDPVHCARFRARLSVDSEKFDLQVSADAVEQDGYEMANEALQETITWLARHPDSDHPGAVTARVMLVEQGHGLQRVGVIAMRQSDERTAHLLREVLTVLAPDVAPVLQAVQTLWMGEDTDQQELFEALARVLEPHVASGDTALQRPENLAVLVTWLTGIFGSRPDRDRRRPARSLFAAFRLIRRLRGDMEAFANPDVDLPTFPTSRVLSDEITRELGFFPPRETDLERLIRAMAVGESTRDFGRVQLDHIRPFALSYRRLRNYPIASQTLLGRYDGIVTMWSFRGRELDRGDVPPHALSDNFVFETTSWASIRAYGRVLGAKSAISGPLADALQSRSERGAQHHPDVIRLAELSALDVPQAIERLERATRARRPNTQRVSDAIGAFEYLVGHATHAPNDDTRHWTPIEPQWDHDEEHAVLRHFMYWRTYCRSYVSHATDAYAAWIERVTPALASLPSKLENEAIALMRTWSRQASTDALTDLQEPLMARLDTLLDPNHATVRDERVLNILSVLADLSTEAYIAGIERLLQHPQAMDAEWHRLLAAVNKNAVRTPWLASPLFRTLGEKLGQADSVGAAQGRVEWMRQCLGRGPNAESVRWLLLRDAWPEVVFEAPFVQWFQQHVDTALDDQQAAIVDLLRLAATQMNIENIDIPMTHLAQIESDKTTEHLQHLLDARRGLSCAAWLSERVTRPEDLANQALRLGLTEAQGARDLRILARLVYAMESEGQTVAADERTALQQRVQQHVVPEYEPAAFDQLLDAWRLVGADLQSQQAGAISKRAAQEILNEDRWRAVASRAFLMHAVDRAVVDAIQEDLFAALGDDGARPLFEAAWTDWAWPTAIVSATQTLAHTKPQSRPYRALWAVLHDGGVSATLETVLDGWVLRRARLSLDETLSEIQRFVPYLASLTEGESTGVPIEDESDLDATTPDVASDRVQEEEASDQPTRAQRLAQTLQEHVRTSVLTRIGATLQFWETVLACTTQDDVDALPQELLVATKHTCPLSLGLRESFYPRVVETLRARGFEVSDPRHVIGNSMIPYSQFTDTRALEMLIAQAATLWGDATHVDASLTRDALMVLGEATAAPDTSENEESAEETPDPRDESSDVEDADITASGDASDDEDLDKEDALDDDADVADDEATPYGETVVAWTLDFDALVARRPANLLSIACTRRVLARTPGLWFNVGKKGQREQIVVAWKPPREKRGGKPRRSAKK